MNSILIRKGRRIWIFCSVASAAKVLFPNSVDAANKGLKRACDRAGEYKGYKCRWFDEQVTQAVAHKKPEKKSKGVILSYRTPNGIKQEKFKSVANAADYLINEWSYSKGKDLAMAGIRKAARKQYKFHGLYVMYQ